jgi:hypothetical protein
MTNEFILMLGLVSMSSSEAAYEEERRFKENLSPPFKTSTRFLRSIQKFLPLARMGKSMPKF